MDKKLRQKYQSTLIPRGILQFSAGKLQTIVHVPETRPKDVNTMQCLICIPTQIKWSRLSGVRRFRLDHGLLLQGHCLLIWSQMIGHRYFFTFISLKSIFPARPFRFACSTKAIRTSFISNKPFLTQIILRASRNSIGGDFQFFCASSFLK